MVGVVGPGEGGFQDRIALLNGTRVGGGRLVGVEGC